MFGVKKLCGKCPRLHPLAPDIYYLYKTVRENGKVVQKYLGRGKLPNAVVVQESESRVVVQTVVQDDSKAGKGGEYDDQGDLGMGSLVPNETNHSPLNHSNCSARYSPLEEPSRCINCGSSHLEVSRAYLNTYLKCRSCHYVKPLEDTYTCPHCQQTILRRFKAEHRTKLCPARQVITA